MRGLSSEVQLKCGLEGLYQTLRDALPIIKNKTLALTNGKKGCVWVQNTWQGRFLPFTDRLYFLISSLPHALVVLIPPFFTISDQIREGEHYYAYLQPVVISESFTVQPHRLCWQAGFTCLGLSAQSGSTVKPTSIVRTLASFPPSPDPVGRWLSAGVFVLSQNSAF